MSQFIKRLRRPQAFPWIVAGVAGAGLGVVVLFYARAQTLAAFEPEDGSLTAVTRTLVSGASGGAVVTFASGPTYYVESGGSDNNNGSSNSPWKTVQKAVDTVPAGAIVRVRPGVYTPFAVRRPNLRILAETGGTVTINGQSGARANIDITANDTTIAGFDIANCRVGTDPHLWDAFPARGNAGVWIDTADRVSVSGLAIHDSYATNTQGQVIGCAALVINDSVSAQILNNDMYRNGYGVMVRGPRSAGTLIQNNKIHDNNALIRNTVTSDNSNDDFGAVAIGFDTLTNTGRHTASNNTLYNNSGPSADYSSDGGGFEIYKASYVTMTNNTLYNNENVLESGTDSGYECQNNVFSGNTAGGKIAGSTVPRSVGMILRCNKDMQVTNNTFTGIDWWVFVIEAGGGTFGGTVTGLTITGNTITQKADKIYALLVQPSGKNFTISNNHLHSDSGIVGTDWNESIITSLGAWQSRTGLDAGSTWF